MYALMNDLPCCLDDLLPVIEFAFVLRLHTHIYKTQMRGILSPLVSR